MGDSERAPTTHRHHTEITPTWSCARCQRRVSMIRSEHVWNCRPRRPSD
ncbi:hypothetical protein HMPREF1549_01091 [Actinomyces johnsonii F0510]|uniref:Uncharacterized protein n=1 Tax=Actinomyces johnsonii F0510 TaxID=1227262 RepID=U1QE68_9ACTO|nr:hypothetical protein HMPREF1549_01091 [Actinomyces johnsonii F0510]